MPTLDVTSAQFRECPFDQYAMFRAQEPVHYDPALHLWHVFRRDDVTRVLLSPGTFSSEGGPRHASGAVDQTSKRDRPGYLSSTDPPRHTWLRSLIQLAFTPRRVAALEPRISEMAKQLLNHVEAASEFDFMGAFAARLPMAVIAELLGVPETDWEMFRRWSDETVDALDAKASRAAAEYPAQRALEEMMTYFRQVIDFRRRRPGDDLISDLVGVERDSQRLTQMDIVYVCVLLLVAGNETTASLIGNTLLTLSDERAVLREIVADHSMIAATVEEVLRYNTPSRGSIRRATEDVLVGQQRIAAGDWVFVWRDSANRDPNVVSDPDRFDIHRRPNPHLGFGHGIHFCLGAALARIEARVALAEFFGRFGDYAVVGPVTKIGTWRQNGPRVLPIRVERLTKPSRDARGS